MHTSRKQLPYLGLGLSTNLDERMPPHPYRLLDSQPGLFDFVEYSAPLDVEEAERDASLFSELWQRRKDVPVLLHPVHLNLFGPSLEPGERLKALNAHALKVGSAWVGNDVAWWHTQGREFPGYLYLPPPFSAEGLAVCVRHAHWVQSELEVPLVLENPAVLSVRGSWHVLDFMAALHARTGAPLLLDLGHLFSYQLAAGLPWDAAFDGFPFESVVELHLAGGVVTRGERGGSVYVDDHSQAIRDEVFTLLERVVPRCRSLRALTLEGDGHPDGLTARTLSMLRPWMPSPKTFQPSARFEAPVTASVELSAAEDERLLLDSAWPLFESIHSPALDDEGGREERALRLCVLAQTLDRRFPLTRLLLAPDADTLACFMASPEYRDVFSSGGRSLMGGFAGWARSEVFQRAGGDEALAAVVAFETLVERAAAEARGAKASITFPWNLGEVFFAARALKRHLCARGWLSGRVALDALEGVRQAARRAPRQSWKLQVRDWAGAVECLGGFT